MDLIFEDRKRRTINKEEEINFSSFSSFHLIAVTARAKGERQLSATDDEDLTVEIDGRAFPKLGTKKALVDSPASFSGGESHDLSETIYFLIFLKGRNHKIILKAEDPPGTATLESLEVYSVNLGSRFDLAPQVRAEEGDRRPWLNFALVDLSLNSFSVSLSLTRRFLDSDDVKVVVDGEVKKNLRNNFRKLWFFISSSLFGEKQGETFATNLPKDLHYLEFSADRMPFFNRITFDLGSAPSSPQGIPTVDNPKWTEDFYDDTEAMLLARMIFGEAENQPKDAKAGVGFTVLNRLKKQQSNWGFNVREIILKESQYDGLWNRYTRDKVRDPLNGAGEKRKQEWQESYEVAREILFNGATDTAFGSTNFHSYADVRDFPDWATDKSHRTKIGEIYFYELER